MFIFVYVSFVSAKSIHPLSDYINLELDTLYISFCFVEVAL